MRSTTEWLFWGRHDPMWAVATQQGRQKDGPQPWTIDDFRASGNADCADIMRHWNHYGRIGGGTCIEIGCGAGRLTSALLDHFERVIGIEVSPDQIELAKRVLGDKLPRVDFTIVENPSIDIEQETCSAMISTHVFQHLSDYSGIVSYLRATHRALVAGGSICFQIPVPGADLGNVLSPLHRAFDSVRARLNRVRGDYRFMEYNRYPVARIVSTLGEIGFEDVELRIFRITATNLRQSFFFARKPSRNAAA